MKFSVQTLRDRIQIPYHFVRTLLAMAGIDRKYTKVFAIGFNKTATSSIHKVFQSAGLHATHSTGWRKSELSAIYFFYQAFSDGPPTNFELLDHRIKGTKFILNVRDLSEWLDSRLQHIKHMDSRGRLDPTIETWQISDFAVKSWIAERNRYHLQVLAYFKDRPDNLLVVNFINDPDAAQKISGFIGKAKVTEKPHTHPIPQQRERGVLRNEERILRCLAELGVPEDEWNTDLYCPSLFAKDEQPDWPANSENL